MGRDNQSRHRRSARELARKSASRASHDRCLIVCEGSKTEPLYLNEIRKYHRLSATNIEVRYSEYGTCPRKVVDFAHDLFINGDPHKKIVKRAFERVYVVFDRDQHEYYRQALDLAASHNRHLKNDLKKLIIFEAIPSIPCFEFWLLLHFEEITYPIRRQEALRRLKTYIVGYEKGDSGNYLATKGFLEEAYSRAERLSQTNNAYTDPEPYTKFDCLVKFLTSLNN